MFRCWQAGEGAEGGVDVDGFGDGGGGFPGGFLVGGSDDEWGVQGGVVEVVFTPDGFFAEAEPMVAPEDDDGVVGGAGFFQVGEELAYAIVDVAGAGGVVLADISAYSGSLFGLFLSA